MVDPVVQPEDFMPTSGTSGQMMRPSYSYCHLSGTMIYGYSDLDNFAAVIVGLQLIILTEITGN